MSFPKRLLATSMKKGYNAMHEADKGILLNLILIWALFWCVHTDSDLGFVLVCTYVQHMCRVLDFRILMFFESSNCPWFSVH